MLLKKNGDDLLTSETIYLSQRRNLSFILFIDILFIYKSKN
ncbi:hypothetical protein HMPREF3182_00541 [Megasphaera hutchinsoni]|uniref:Uncharacterized protein n=1 Tax=Megasphaera hutchinsoni TaxID=1588748 RepID=A0A134CJB9_9FIRM|nr:hypothetical protein HMPREF3182_00541 [Megasphaera hutchinsoni]